MAAKSLAAESIRLPAAWLERAAAATWAEIAAAGKTSASALGGESALQPLGKIVAIIAPHHFVADAVGELLDARFQRGDGVTEVSARPNDRNAWAGGCSKLTVCPM